VDKNVTATLTAAGTAAAQGCPHAARAAAAASAAAVAATDRDDIAGAMLHARDTGDALPSAAGPELYTFTQVKALMPDDHPLAITTSWIKSFLARPHKDLGRPGPVCPFVPGAITQDTIWLANVPEGRGDRQAIIDIIGRYRDLFLELEPKTGDSAMMKAMVIVFPNVPSDDAGVIDEVQFELKSQFVEAGMMIGEFHERNDGGGLRNPDFRPLRSPIPSLAIRFMVETDLPFMNRPLYSPSVRAGFIRSYIRRLGTTISRHSFDVALNSLIAAQLQLRDEVGETVQQLSTML
jgi:hypothetical protein